MAKSHLEDLLAQQIKVLDLPTPIREHRFHPPRRWRLDFFWPCCNFAVEVEGGTFTGGRHTRGLSFEKDCEKYAQAMLDGITVYRCTGNIIKRGEAVQIIEKMLCKK